MRTQHSQSRVIIFRRFLFRMFEADADGISRGVEADETQPIAQRGLGLVEEGHILGRPDISQGQTLSFANERNRDIARRDGDAIIGPTRHMQIIRERSRNPFPSARRVGDQNDAAALLAKTPQGSQSAYRIE